MKKFLKTLWSVVWPLGLYLLLALIVEMVYSLCLMFSEYYKTGTLDLENIMDAAAGESLGTTAIVSAVTIVICIFIIRSDRRKHEYDSEQGHADITFAAIIAAIGGCLLGNYVLSVSGIMESDATFDIVNEAIMSAPIWLQILAAVILAPICEELMFRGIVYKRIEYSYGFWPAAIISSLLFGALHGNLSQFIYAAALGLLFAYAYRKSGRLQVCILMHLIANLASLVLDSLVVMVDNYAVVEAVQIVTGSLLLGTGLFLMIKSPQESKKQACQD
ncbi:MAG: CPBP family intramembrane metalloprotease [Lachnospiraceae bacterium]|nr:CPBP family intramembrane metalloprotease [Lachnospiraceae bacterium]